MRLNKKVNPPASVQYAALPYRTSESTGVEVLLVTSRTTKRWIIPKGWPLDGKSPHATAALEAREEAGLVGRIAEQAIGSYSYMKRLKSGEAIECEVHVFPMEVTGQKRRWPDKGKREAQWFSTEVAAATIEDPVLANLIRLIETTEPASSIASRARKYPSQGTSSALAAAFAYSSDMDVARATGGLSAFTLAKTKTRRARTALSRRRS